MNLFLVNSNNRQTEKWKKMSKDETGPTVKEEDDMEAKHTGYVQNICEINQTTFTSSAKHKIMFLA
jgi:hypothetical protein